VFSYPEYKSHGRGGDGGGGVCREVLQEKQTHVILRWLQSGLIVHEDLQNQ